MTSIIGKLVIGALATVLAAAPVMAEDGTSEAAEAVAVATDQSAKETVRCVDLHRIRQSRVIDDRNIMLDLRGGGEVVHVKLKNRCSGLKASGGYNHATSTGDLCRADTLRVIESRGMGSVCLIDEMVKITRDEAKAIREALKTKG